VPGHFLPDSSGSRPPENAARTDLAAHMAAMSIPRPPKPGQSLADRFPTVAVQWHPTRNGNLRPDQVNAGTDAKVWWRCEQGHGWEAPVSRLTRQSTGCPVCTGRTVLAGYNDLATTFPDIAKQWHPTRNGNLRPDQVNAGTDAKVWWRCELGHEWKAAVRSRTSKSYGCPVCAGRQVITGFNDLTTRSPAVAKQWHPTRNGDLRPDQVSAGSNTKAWWRCEEGHEWEAKIKNRTSKGGGCPVYSRR